MKLYIAGKSKEYRRMRDLMSWARERGHEVTYDWTTEVEWGITGGEETDFMLRGNAKRDAEGVRDCDAIIAMIDGDWHYKGTYFEMGIAYGVAWGAKPIIFVGQNSMIFLHLPGLYRAETFGAALDLAEKMEEDRETALEPVTVDLNGPEKVI